MVSDFDPNKMFAEIVAKQFNGIFESLMSCAGRLGSNLKAKFKHGLNEYLSRSAEYVCKTKTFFIKNAPVYLYSFYVPLGIQVATITINKPTFASLSDVSMRLVVTGSAGCGKTIMMKHLAHGALENNIAPIFIELRKAKLEDCSIFKCLVNHLNEFGLVVDDCYLEAALSHGGYAVFLDGFDEIEHRHRDKTIEELRLMANRYANTSFIVSSRPDNVFKGLSGFVEASILPLDLELAQLLVCKLPFDESVKERFSSDLATGMFGKHKSFLSNPLLLSIMLLTYGDCADIPNKLSVFYKHAYDALYMKHDAYKGAYRRDRKTSLDIREFATVFGAFCIVSYAERSVQFTQSEALNYLETAKKITRIDFDVSDFLSDSIQAVCLLLEDGLSITFTHRTFQEYFAAKYICSTSDDIQRILLSKFSKYVYQDSLMALVMEIDITAFENSLIIPMASSVNDFLSIKKNVTLSHYAKYIMFSFDEIILYINDSSEDEVDVPKMFFGMTPCKGEWAELFECVRYLYLNYKSEVRERSYIINDNGLEDILRRYGQCSSEGYIVKPKGLSPRSKFFAELSTAQSYFSFDALKWFLSTAKEIVAIHDSDRHSLRTLFNQ